MRAQVALLPAGAGGGALGVGRARAAREHRGRLARVHRHAGAAGHPRPRVPGAHMRKQPLLPCPAPCIVIMMNRYSQQPAARGHRAFTRSRRHYGHHSSSLALFQKCWSGKLPPCSEACLVAIQRLCTLQLRGSVCCKTGVQSMAACMPAAQEALVAPNPGFRELRIGDIIPARLRSQYEEAGGQL